MTPIPYGELTLYTCSSPMMSCLPLVWHKHGGPSAHQSVDTSECSTVASYPMFTMDVWVISTHCSDHHCTSEIDYSMGPATPTNKSTRSLFLALVFLFSKLCEINF